MKERLYLSLPGADRVLPTSEMVQRGVSEYDRIMGTLSHEGRSFLASPKLWRVFVGTTPEAGGWSMNLFSFMEPEAQAEVENAFATSEDFMIVHRKYKNPENDRYSFFNIPATRRLMKEYPRYFPKEAVEDPREWFPNNPLKWIREIPYGLLSGFPPHSVLRFRSFRDEAVHVDSIGEFRFHPTQEDHVYIDKSNAIYEASGIKEVSSKWGFPPPPTFYEIFNRPL